VEGTDIFNSTKLKEKKLQPTYTADGTCTKNTNKTNFKQPHIDVIPHL